MTVLSTIVNPNTDLAEVMFLLAAFAAVICIVLAIAEDKSRPLFFAGLILGLLSVGLLFTA